MLSVLGFAMVAVFMTLIMTGRMAPLVALILVPVVFGLAAGHGLDLGPMMLEGVRKIAPTGVMIMFAILYFGLMIDAGLFDPVVRGLLRVMRGDPVRVVVGSVGLAVVVSLDGDGSTAYMVCVAALLPLYRRIGLDPRIMACLLMLSSGVMNLIPWGGPTARAAAALQVEVEAIFPPLIPVMAVGVGWLLLLAWFYGRRERRRLGVLSLPGSAAPDDPPISVSTDPAARRPRLVGLNAALTVGLLLALVSGAVPLTERAPEDWLKPPVPRVVPVLRFSAAPLGSALATPNSSVPWLMFVLPVEERSSTRTFVSCGSPAKRAATSCHSALSGRQLLPCRSLAIQSSALPGLFITR